MSDFRKKKMTGMIKGQEKKIQSEETKTSARIKLRYDTGVEISRLRFLTTMMKMLRDLMEKAVTCNRRWVR